MFYQGCRFFLHFSYLALLFCAKAAFSLSETLVCDATINNPCIVQDANSDSNHVDSLRDLSMIAQYYPGNIVGIDNLLASASRAPDKSGWYEIIDFIMLQSPISIKAITVVDLRQESHGYLNGLPINLTTLHNWINVNKSKENVREAEISWLNYLKSQKKIYHVLTPQQFDAKEYNSGKTLKIGFVKSEEELVTEAGLGYFRLNISDHRAPADSEVDDFIQFYRTLPANTWLHFHCRGGKGRSTTFLALTDMLNNADKVSFDDIIARQASIPPFYNLGSVERNDPELTPFYEERLSFLREFYQYAQESLAGYDGSWSQWKRERVKEPRGFFKQQHTSQLTNQFLPP